MSPELLDPEKFDLKDGRPTKRSDCYALGMTIYEVLSGRIPFYRHGNLIAILVILQGEFPERPQGTDGAWFTDEVWGILERCWNPTPGERPEIEDVLQCLGSASRSWTPPFHDPDSSDEASDEEGTDNDEDIYPSQTVTFQSLQNVQNDCPDENTLASPTFSAPPHCAPDRQDLGMSPGNPNVLDTEGPAGIPDTVS